MEKFVKVKSGHMFVVFGGLSSGPHNHSTHFPIKYDWSRVFLGDKHGIS